MHTLVGPDLGSAESLVGEQPSEQRQACVLFFERRVHGSREGDGVSKEELHGRFQHTRLEDLGKQLPRMAPKDTNHLPQCLMPVFEIVCCHPFSRIMSIFVYSFIKNCQWAIWTDVPFLQPSRLHKCYDRYKITLEI